MKKTMTGQFVPGDSVLHQADARAKFFGFLLFTAAIILADSMGGYLAAIGAVFMVGYASALPLRMILGSVKSLFFFFVVVFCMNAFFYQSKEPILQWAFFTFSAEGMLRGFSVVFRVVLILVLSNLLTLTTPPRGIMEAIETMLRPLSVVRLPAEEIAMILSIAMQFIPTLMEETDVIRKAQTARGARFESKRLRELAMAMLPLVAPIFIAAFKRADELSMAMEARGYRGAGGRTQKESPPMDRRSWIGLCGCGMLCAAELLIF